MPRQILHVPPIAWTGWNSHYERARRAAGEGQWDIEARRFQIQQEAKKNEEKLKNTKWTRDELRKLVREQEKILDGREAWNPQAFNDDLKAIRRLIHRKGKDSHLEGTEKESLSADPYGMDFIYGLLLQEHFLQLGFYIETAANSQPILHDNNKPDPEDPAKQKKREQQMAWLQAALRSSEFQHDVGSVASRYDNTHQITVYLTAAAYHGQPEKDLTTYIQNLEGSIQKDPLKPLTADQIKASSLDTGQKSMLLAWQRDKDGDIINGDNLALIQKNQLEKVERAREFYDKKTFREKVVDVVQNPMKAVPMLLAAGFIGACLYGAIKLFKKWGFFGTVGAMILGLVGGGLALQQWSKLWKSSGAGDYVADRINGVPVDRKEAADNPPARITEKMKELWSKAKGWIENLQTRIAGPEEWSLLLMREDVGPQITAYPAGALLYALNSGRPTEQWEFTSYEKNPKMAEIRATLGKLNDVEKGQLLALVSTSWERQKEIDAKKKETTIQDDLNPSAQNLNLGKLIKNIDDSDSWWNTLPDWTGWKNGLFAQNTAKTEALKVMASDGDPTKATNIERWGTLTLKQIENHFITKPQITDAVIQQIIIDYNNTHPNSDPSITLEKYFNSLVTPATTNKDTTTLRDFLKS